MVVIPVVMAAPTTASKCSSARLRAGSVLGMAAARPVSAVRAGVSGRGRAPPQVGKTKDLCGGRACPLYRDGRLHTIRKRPQFPKLMYNQM